MPAERRPAGRRPRERAARGDRAGRSRSDDEPLEKVAPWWDWTPVALRASSGDGDYPVRFTVSGHGREQNARYSELITAAAYEHFRIEKPPREDEGPAAYLVGARRLRVVYDELIVEFDPGVAASRCAAIIDEAGFRDVERNRFVEREWIVRHVRPGIAGKSLLAAAEAFARFEEVRYAWPNSVAEYIRTSTPAPSARRWWLDRIGVNWATGRRRLLKGNSNVVIAILDDGVDIEHPNLASRFGADPGKDFAVAANQPEHANPRPKVRVAADPASDYHGTLCAGLICSDGSRKKFMGAAPGCSLIALRVIAGAKLVKEAWVADAIRYATDVADIISCSWVGDRHAKVVSALNATKRGRGGKGTAVFCSAGNHGTQVEFPARHRRAIAVGACGHDDEQTDYSNVGNDLDVVTPSSNGIPVYSTDVSKLGWGYNKGVGYNPPPGDALGLFHGEFGGTSAAAAIAAGVGALCLSANPNLTAKQLRGVLQDTAVKIAKKPQIIYTAGHSKQFGYGCINAAEAVKRAKQMLAPRR